MNMAWGRCSLAGPLCVMVALLAGCSAKSGSGLGGNAGNQSALKPQAVITPIGNVADATGTLYVRSGAEVLLSSKDSDGRDSAILGVTWAPVNAAAQAVRMLERGANAMSFRAPVPPDATPLELRFSLTVHTADGDTASSEIRVLVNRVPDPNDFLLSDVATSADAVNLVVVASSYTSAASFSTDIPFTISVQKQVRYKRAITTGANPSTNVAATDALYCASTDPAITCVKIGQPLQLTGTWKQASGVSGTTNQLLSPPQLPRTGTLGTPYQNPRFRLRPPALNVDEVNFAVLTGGNTSNLNGTGVPADDSRRNNLLYTADIGDAEAEYAITMSSTDLAATGRRPDLLVFAANAADATTSLTFLGEGLAAAGDATATATITATTALNSIKATGGAVVESRDTAAAYYAAIDPDNKRATLDDWLNDNCMQRSLAGPPGYYGSDIHSTYLNNHDLGFGREMYFKTDCTTAQRTATGATINTVGGERASIVFNYSSLEGAIKRSGAFLAVAMEYRADAGGGIKYTRFYTFAPDPRTGAWKRVQSANFDGRRERYTPGNCTVCHGGKPRASYAGGADLGATFIPWDANALLFADTDASILDDRLKPGFTRAEQLPNIQALNVQGVRPIIANRTADTQPTGDTLARFNATLDLLDHWYSDPAKYDYVPPAWHGLGTTAVSSDALYSTVIAENCRMCHMQRITDPGPSGLALATAPQFNSFADVDGDVPIETTRLKQRVFEQHLMPASRLTSDRFWIAQPGSNQSAAQVLAAHLGLTLPAAVPGILAAVDAPPANVDPGQPSATVRLSALQSRFAASYNWTLQKPAGSNAALVGANTAEPAFLADVSGTYTANLTVTDSAGHDNVLGAPVVIVANRKPVGGSSSVTANIGATVSLDLFGAGGTRPGDGANTITILSQPAGSGATVQANCTSACTLSFTATASGTIHYRITDADGDFTTGDVSVTVNVPNQWNPRAYHGNLAFDDAVTCASGVNACSRVVTGLDPSALARAALSLTPSQYSALNYTATVSFSQAPFRVGRVARPAGQTGVASSATSVTYTSPPLFTSAQDTSGTVSKDSFTYSITVRDAASNLVTQSAADVVQMTVNPRVRWATVLTTLQGLTCNSSSCHSPAPDYTIRAWGFAPYVSGTTSYDTYEQLAGVFRNSCPAGDTGTPKCIDYTNPAGSLLLQKPQGQYTHTGGVVLDANVPADSAVLVAIENWIRDGAYRN